MATPTEKSETDDPIPRSLAWERYPEEMTLGAHCHQQVREYLAPRGITLIDGKIEALGTMLIDDWFNGDCCRFALTEQIREGEEPPFLDKERFRQLAELKWGDGPRAPLIFTEEEIREGLAPYHAGFELITGMSLTAFRRDWLA